MAGKIDSPVLTIVQYTDPYCTWCWGSEPIMRKIETVYGSQIDMEFVMGGLVRDVSMFFDPLNKIGGTDMFRQVADHWREASERHGMPVDADVWLEMKEEFRSTWPANIACKAAQMQGADLGNRFIRRMREAAAAERLYIHRLQVQTQLAMEVGLEHERFILDIDSGAAEEAFQKDLEMCRRHGVQGFPTFIVRNRSGAELGLNGFHAYRHFERVFEELGDGTLKAGRILAGEEAILGFVRRYWKVAPREIEETFSLAASEVDDWLEPLTGKGLVSAHPAGNGWFYTAEGQKGLDN